MRLTDYRFVCLRSRNADASEYFETSFFGGEDLLWSIINQIDPYLYVFDKDSSLLIYSLDEE